MKSCRALGDSSSGKGLGKDIGVHRLAAVQITQGNFRHVLQRGCGVGDALALVELVVTHLDSRFPGGYAHVFGLHALQCVANDFGRVAVETGFHFAFNKTFHLG
jgi:hypothetical protein